MARETQRGRLGLAAWGWLVIALLTVSLAGAADRGVLVVRDQTGNQVGLYRESHALLVGISDYTAGWPDLESVPRELGQVERALKAQGFNVVKVLDADAEQLERAFKGFIDDYGYRRSNRLLFFFAGHGHTWEAEGHGYLVPSDAPRPVTEKGDPGAAFLRKALFMSDILAWSKQMTANHALFLFDSCFSGAVFKERALPSQPPHITRAIARPVREFITAGSAGETVPARSVFTPAFVDALEYAEGDLNRDGYVTGMELGLHLEATVPRYARQSPQFGKHPEYRLSRGDFVFAVKAPPADEAVTDPAVYEDASPRAPQEQLARLTVRSNVRGDTVYINGQARGPIGPKVHELAPGTYAVRVEKPGYESWERRVVLAAGDRETVRAELVTAPRPNVPDTGIPWDSERSGRRDGETGTEDESRPAPPSALSVFRDTLQDGSQGPEMVVIPAGSITIGSTASEQGRHEDEGSPRRVTIAKPLAIGKYEVTFEEYDRFADATGSQRTNDHAWGRGTRPVLYVSWEDARKYAAWLSEQTGKRYRLPTEAEWEYAARAGTETAFWWGQEVGKNNANCATCGSRWDWEQTAPVGSFRPNPWGLHDTAGNLWEWVQDCWHISFTGVPTNGSAWKEGDCAQRVIRGGSFYHKPRRVRSASRAKTPPGSRYKTLGVRLARDF